MISSKSVRMRNLGTALAAVLALSVATFTASPAAAQNPPAVTPGETPAPGGWVTFPLTDTDEDGRVERRQGIGQEVRLSGGERLFVGEDIGDTEAYLSRLTQALWMAMGMVLLLGLLAAGCSPLRLLGPRQQLLSEVWEQDFLGDSRLVDNCVQRLRAKIETDPAAPVYVQTVRGFGYRFGPL